jgi:MoaA/NifB/PqqE/SkfB family radical SAM enzyme
MNTRDIVSAWGRVLTGSVPLLSIEITRECPLSCPGCYAYGDDHLGGSVTLRTLSDRRGDALIEGVLDLVRCHRPLHVSLVGGEPLVRHRELSRILPELSAMGVWAMVVTSAVIPVPVEWMSIPNFELAVSVDGLPEHHDIRRTPATYERILRNITGCRVNIHLTVTQPMLERDGYLLEYFDFWSARAEVNHIWMSTYTPQVRERSPEMLTAESRSRLIALLPELCRRFPKLLIDSRTPTALAHPPASPRHCSFARMSINYSADLATRVEPCIFGGNPDCSQCGCAISVALHAIQDVKVKGPVRVRHLVNASTCIGATVNRFRRNTPAPVRWRTPVLDTSAD